MGTAARLLHSPVTWFSAPTFTSQLRFPGFQEVVAGQPLASPSLKLLQYVMFLQLKYCVLLNNLAQGHRMTLATG